MAVKSAKMLTFAYLFGRLLKNHCAQASDSKRHHLNTGIGEALANGSIGSISERVGSISERVKHLTANPGEPFPKLLLAPW